MKRSFEAADVQRIRLPSDPRVSPDGTRVLYALKTVDPEKRIVISNLWIVRPGEPARPFTRGKHRDMVPRWSPDGRWVAFLTNRKDPEGSAEGPANGKPQIALIPADGGEARIVTRIDGAIGGFSFAPDGKRMVVCMRRPDPLPEGESSPVSIRVTRLRYKFDGAGYLPQDHFHLYMLDLETAPELVPLTDGDWDDTGPVFSPDGRHIAFFSNRRDDRDVDDENRDLFLMPSGGGEPRCLTRLRGVSYAAGFSPDGRHIAFITCPGPKGNSFWDNAHVHAVATTGDDGEWDLTPDLDRSAINVTISELYGLEHLISTPAFDAAGRSVSFVVADSGRSWIARVPLVERGAAPGPVEVVHEGESVVTFQQGAPGGPLAILVSTPTVPARLLFDDLSGRPPVLLDDPNAAWLEEVDLVEAEELRVESEPGIPTHGWLMRPGMPGNHPLILYIHGGPHLAYGVPFNAEFQYLVGRGYAVLFPNPRGSHGYGREFARCVLRDWADGPFRDLMACVDQAVAGGGIDPDRLGVAGGSYGGYMTLWIAGHTHRFKAACAQRPVASLEGMAWSDFGGFMDWLLGAIPWDEPELCRRLSPVEYARSIETPLLLVLGLADQRTPPDQGERMYVTLKSMGKPVEMVLFPGADHHLSRTGRPSQQVARMEAISEWFDRHLAAPTPAAPEA